VIDDLSKYISTNQSIGLAWVYCDGTRRVSAKTENRYIFGSILRQLLQGPLNRKVPGVIEFAENLRRCNGDATDSTLETSFIHTIRQLNSQSELYVVIDGIDECPNPPDLCEKILQMAQPKVKILVSSRSERNIAEAFQNQKHLELTEDQLRRDMETYIEWALENENGLKKVKREMKEEIKAKLLEKNNAM
jgi:hypothetical protein